jgi:uncharacterized repeat protein (TIGR02543 family)
VTQPKKTHTQNIYSKSLKLKVLQLRNSLIKSIRIKTALNLIIDKLKSFDKHVIAIILLLTIISPFLASATTAHGLTEDQYVTIFDLNYSTTGKVPSSIIYGLIPTIQCRYTVDISWSGDGLYLAIGGVRLRCYSSSIRGIYCDASGAVRSAFTWNLGTNRVIITIDTDTALGKATISVKTYKAELHYYKAFWYEDKSANTFAPDTASFTPVNSATIKLYRLTQQVKAPSLTTAIGSTKYQAFGYYGPQTANTVTAGMNEINNANMEATIFADVDYIRDSTYLQYLKGLISSGWELGIHFSEVITDMTWTEAQAAMRSEYAAISKEFGTPPLTWCILDVGGFDDPTKTQWVKDNLNMIIRDYRTVPQDLSGIYDLRNYNFDYFLGAAKTGVQTLPVYVYQTEVEPASSYSIDASKFDAWLSYIKNNGVSLTGYYKWYKINSNQLDAKFYTSTEGSITKITVDTNGYNAFVLVKIKADLVTSLKRGNQLIPYSKSPEGYIFFEAVDGGIYTVTTTSSVNYSLTVNTVGQGIVVKFISQSSYVAGSNVQLTANPSAGWVFSGWSGDLTGTANPTTITVNGNKIVTATFTQSTSTQYTLTIQQQDGLGSTTPATGSYKYNQGSSTKVTATPSSGHIFSHWLLDGVNSGSSNPTSVTMNTAHTLKAVFTQTESQWATVFYQDYSQASVVPASISSYSYNQAPTIQISKVNNYVQITKTTSSYHFAHVYGFTNQIKCRYIIELEWTNAGFYLNVGGVSLYCLKSGSYYYINGQYEDYAGHTYYPYPFQWNIGTNSHVTITIDTNTKGINPDGTKGNAYISIVNSSGATFGPSFLIHAEYLKRLNYGANLFTSNTLGIMPDATTSIKLFKVRQDVQTTNLVTAVGSNKYQAYGYDGPHTYSTIGAGMNEITAAGTGGTIFVDVEGYIDPTYLTYLKKLLDAGTGWDLGIHFTEYWDPDTTHPNGYTMNQKIANMNADYSILTQMFGEPPLTWCALGHSNTAEEALWAKTNLNLIERAWRVTSPNFDGAYNLVNTNYEFWLNAAKAGYATLPIYVHETEPNPTNSPTLNIDGSKFDVWLKTIIANGVHLIGYYNWYMIQSNQITATFSSSTSGSDTTITADTNGYNAIILVKIKANSVTAVKRGTQAISYSTSPEGYIIFEVADGGTYTVTTKTASTQYPLTTSVVGQGTVSKSPSQSTYTSGSTVQLTATPSTGWIFSSWSGSLTSSTNPATVTINGNMAVTATFTQPTSTQYTLTIQQPEGSGSTTPNVGSYTYSQGSIAQVTATPTTGYTFSHWLQDGIDAGTSNPTTVTMNAAHTLKAAFTQTGQYPLTVQASGGTYTTTKQDGTTVYSGSNAAQAIQTALNTAKPGDTIQIKPGTYPITSQLTGKSGVSLKGEGLPTLDFSTQTAYATLITEYGSTTGTYYPTTDLTKGQTTITTTTSIGAAAGTLIFVKSTTVWRSNSMGNMQGEIRRVTAVNGNTLTLEAPLEDTYQKAVTTITKINPVKDITIDGIKFLNSNCAQYTNGVTRKHFRGLYFNYGDNIRVTNCVFDGIEYTAIRLENVVNSRIDHNVFRYCTTDGAGYGVNVCYGCQNVVIEYNEAYGCRHWVVAGDGGGSPGIPRHITVQKNYSVDSRYWVASTSSWGTQQQYDCHPVGEDIDFLYNEATGTGIGLYYQAYSGSIVGNNFHDLTTGGYMGIGIGFAVGWVGADGLTHYQDDVLVQGNTVSNTILWGIEVGNENPRYAANVRILDNRISGCPVYGIYMLNTKDSLVNNNVITGVTATGDAGIFLDASTSNILGSGNTITGCSALIVNYGSGNNVN